MASTKKLTMYRITLKCHGVPADEGAQAAKNIEAEFAQRSHHTDVHCWWDGRSLFVTSWNDFDASGLALRDEFSTAVAAYVDAPSHEAIEIVEVLSMG